MSTTTLFALWLVVVTFVGSAQATCGGSLSSSFARDDLEGAIEYLHVSSPYSVTIVPGSQFLVVFNGTDGGEIDSFFASEQSANISLLDNSSPSASPSAPQPRRPVSTADRPTAAHTVISFLALVLGVGAMQFFPKGFTPLFVLIVALSTINIITSHVLPEAPCNNAGVTLHIPLGTVRFVCVNHEPCVCGPGFTGDECTAAAPTATAPTASAPTATPDAGPPVSSTCSDATKNGLETDVDCGGGACPRCTPGYACQDDSDCTSNICSSGTCTQPSCSDAVQNGDETDKDCGGSLCPKCTAGKVCEFNSDCDSANCFNLLCQQSTCTDTIQNQDESDVDCGGACAKCLPGDSCNDNSDCDSSICKLDGTCAQSSCTDGVQNAAETDVDCGGVTCSPCTPGSQCNGNSDCDSSVCVNGNCATPSCVDGVKNGDEADKDCGGTCINKCSVGQMCTVDTDCQSSLYCSPGKICTQPTCSDNMQNGLETDVDCGGSSCPSCSNGKKCVVGSDCQSGLCSSLICSIPDK